MTLDHNRPNMTPRHGTRYKRGHQRCKHKS